MAVKQTLKFLLMILVRTRLRIRCSDVVTTNIIARVNSSNNYQEISCLAETPGISQCYDAQGRSAGKVVADKNGNTIVYNDKDVPIGTGSVRKISETSYEVRRFLQLKMKF